MAISNTAAASDPSPEFKAKVEFCLSEHGKFIRDPSSNEIMWSESTVTPPARGVTDRVVVKFRTANKFGGKMLATAVCDVTTFSKDTRMAMPIYTESRY